MKTLLLISAASFPFVSALRAEEHKLSGDNTTIKFVGSKKDGKHEGTFPKVDGKLTVDHADVSKSKLEVSIDITSMKTDSEKLTGHLKSPDFFDAKKYPQAKFVSTSIKADGKDKYSITGDLTLHGKTHAVTFPATAVHAGDTTTVSGETEIDRNNWDITYGKGNVNAAVKLTLEVKVKTKAK